MLIYVTLKNDEVDYIKSKLCVKQVVALGDTAYSRVWIEISNDEIKKTMQLTNKTTLNTAGGETIKICSICGNIFFGDGVDAKPIKQYGVACQNCEHYVDEAKARMAK